MQPSRPNFAPQVPFVSFSVANHCCQFASGVSVWVRECSQPVEFQHCSRSVIGKANLSEVRSIELCEKRPASHDLDTDDQTSSSIYIYIVCQFQRKHPQRLERPWWPDAVCLCKLARSSSLISAQLIGPRAAILMVRSLFGITLLDPFNHRSSAALQQEATHAVLPPAQVSEYQPDFLLQLWDPRRTVPSCALPTELLFTALSLQ